ncbi:hypothetical protein D9758_004891 [Tetrapyrgos nigripes]|uniref:Peptidase S53 activation domain-containing protein n=1 Tax=Tetrapyrgos nigripes TaxID=182062 RepID=A0A8H5G5Z1_9AGAR|nr:hypothetical protein D9758_004891 [Tetrapyrgos nigripes]
MKTLSIVVVVTLGFGLGTLSTSASSSSPTIPIAISHVHGYTRFSRASSPLPHPLKFALTQPSSSLSQIDRYLYEVSDPSSDKFGKHWSVERIREVFEPSGETVRIVREWLEETGYEDDENETMTNISKPKPKPKRAVTYKNGWIEVHATVGEAERLLSTEYHVYAHIDRCYLSLPVPDSYRFLGCLGNLGYSPTRPNTPHCLGLRGQLYLCRGQSWLRFICVLISI